MMAATTTTTTTAHPTNDTILCQCSCGIEEQLREVRPNKPNVYYVHHHLHLCHNCRYRWSAWFDLGSTTHEWWIWICHHLVWPIKGYLFFWWWEGWRLAETMENSLFVRSISNRFTKHATEYYILTFLRAESALPRAVRDFVSAWELVLKTTVLTRIPSFELSYFCHSISSWLTRPS